LVGTHSQFVELGTMTTIAVVKIVTFVTDLAVCGAQPLETRLVFGALRVANMFNDVFSGFVLTDILGRVSGGFVVGKIDGGVVVARVIGKVLAGVTDSISRGIDYIPLVAYFDRRVPKEIRQSISGGDGWVLTTCRGNQ